MRREFLCDVDDDDDSSEMEENKAARERSKITGDLRTLLSIYPPPLTASIWPIVP